MKSNEKELEYKNLKRKIKEIQKRKEEIDKEYFELVKEKYEIDRKEKSYRKRLVKLQEILK